MKHNTLELLHLDAIKRATKDTLFKVQDSLEYSLCYTHAGVTKKIAIDFCAYCFENQEELMHLDSYEKRFNHFLKTKQ